MILKLNENCTLDKPGVYFIVNIINGKKYIGSSTMKIKHRIQHHFSELKRNNHKNTHLQNAWNLYGEDNFVFEIVINLEKDQCFIKEQEYLDNTEDSKRYNINPLATGTPSLSKETIEKRGKCIKKAHDERLPWVDKVKSGECEIEGVPENFRRYVLYRINYVSPKKGHTKETMDFSYLKGVKKTQSSKVIEARNSKIQKQIENSTEVYVYSSTDKFLGYWKNAFELEKDSNSPNFILNQYMILRNKKGRNGYSPNILRTFNVQKSINKQIKYKGLKFSNKPLHEEIHVE